MNWSSDHRRLDADTKLLFGLFAQIPENPGDQIFQRVLSTENLSAAKVAARQKRLERLNQSTLHFGGKIVLNALRSCPRLQSIHAAFLHPLQVQQRPIRIRQLPQIWERGKLDLVRAVGAGNGTVR